MTEDELRQIVRDEEHLKLLAIGYYVSAGLDAFFSLFGLVYALMGLMIGTAIATATNAASSTGQPSPQFIGWIFGIFGLVFFLFMLILAILKFYAARSIKRRRARIFCMVIAAITCLGIPYGTLLGILTFLVLARNSVETLFKSANTGGASPAT